MLDVVNRLLEVKAEMVVTATAPLDRHRPNNEEDRIRLRNLAAEARQRVLESAAGGESDALLQHVDDAFSQVDLGSGALGYAVIATADGSETHMLPFPVSQVVSVATTPATRALVQGLNRSPRYRVLVVSDRAARLFQGVRDDLQEITEHGFPFAADVVPRDLRAVAGRFAREPAGDDKEQWRNFYRRVDDGLTAVSGDDPLPVVLAGVDVSVALFEAVSANTASVLARISGAQENATAHTLGSEAWPLLRCYLEDRRRDIVAELAKATHARKAVTGIDESWQLGREGRGRTLVVEETYRAEPACEVDHRLVRAERGAPGTMEDPVDDLVEHVVRSGGTVEFVAADALAHVGRIGLILR